MQFTKIIFFSIALAALSGAATAGIRDELDKLEGKVVVVAGDVEQVDCPIAGQYDCTTWPRNLLRFKYRNMCFVSDFLACADMFGCQGIVAVGKNGVPSFFSIPERGGDIQMFSYTPKQCPPQF